MTMFGSQWLANAGADAHEIDQSIRFNDGDSPFLTRTPGSASNRDTWTWSAWIKICTIDQNSRLFFAGADTSNLTAIRLNSSGIAFEHVDGGAFTDQVQTSAVLRDPSAWYHIVFAVDTTQSTEANRVKIYINGTVQTSLSLSNYPSQNVDTDVNSADVHSIGSRDNAGLFFDGYMAEINFIDGTAKAASDFGEYSDGVWIPKKYSGAYGTNGFFIDGRDSSDLGDDESGNGNDFASSGLAGAADQMLDSPTINFSTMNPLAIAGGATEFLNGNLDLDQDNFGRTKGTIAFDVQDSDGFYFEVKKTSGNASASYRMAGIVATTSDFGTANVGSINPSVTYYMEGGEVNQNGSLLLGSLATFTLNDVLGVAVRNGKVYFAKNDTYVNSGDPEGESGHCAAITGSAPLYTALVGETNNQTGVTSTVNFGATAFAHSPPSGYKKINTANLPTPAVKDGTKYFQTTLYEGDGSTQSIDQAGNSTFSPNLVWIKNRDAADAHALFDTVRGATKVLSSNVTTAEATNDDTLTAFESDGFALGDDVIVNTNAESYVAWQWNEGATPGFDIVSYTGNATARTIAHNLGVVPEMMIVKNRADTDNWAVYHAANTAAPATDYLVLNANSATADDATVWNDTAPTSSVFSVGTSSLTNGNTEAMIAYVFAPVEGFSKFGSYIGNGSSSGPMFNLGFRPAWFLVKQRTGTESWYLFDDQRDPFNYVRRYVLANHSNAEVAGVQADISHDFLSNGIKIRTDNSFANANGATYVYAAFAKSPFKTANAR